MRWFYLTILALSTTSISMCLADSELFQAVWAGEYATVVRKLGQGADPDMIDTANSNESLLFLAVKSHKTKIAATLLEHGAGVATVDDDGFTPLYHASVLGNLPMVEALIRKGADPAALNERDCNRTILHACATPGANNRCNGIILKALINTGASLKAEDCNGTTIESMVENTSKLETWYPSSKTTNSTSEKFVKTVLAGDRNGVKQLLENVQKNGKYADVDSEAGTTHLTALFLAVISNNTEMAQLLLDSGASLYQTDQAGNTALYYAVRFGLVKMARLLIDNYADVNAVNRLDCSQSAIMACFQPPVAFANRCSPDLIKLLLDKGANPHLSDCSGRSAETMALVHLGDASVLSSAATGRQSVHQLGTDDNETTLFDQIQAGDIIGLQLSLSSGTDVEAVEPQSGLTPLLYSLTRPLPNQEATVRLLLSNSAKSNKTYDKNLTILHAAVVLGKASLVRILLDHGLNANAVTNDCLMTPLMACARPFFMHFRVHNQCNSVIARLLVKFGARLDARNCLGMTASRMAANSPDAGLIEVLNELDARHSFRRPAPPSQPAKPSYLDILRQLMVYLPKEFNITVHKPKGVTFSYPRDDPRLARIVLEFTVGSSLETSNSQHAVLGIDQRRPEQFVYHSFDLALKEGQTITYQLAAVLVDGRTFFKRNVTWTYGDNTTVVGNDAFSTNATSPGHQDTTVNNIRSQGNEAGTTGTVVTWENQTVAVTKAPINFTIEVGNQTTRQGELWSISGTDNGTESNRTLQSTKTPETIGNTAGTTGTSNTAAANGTLERTEIRTISINEPSTTVEPAATTSVERNLTANGTLPAGNEASRNKTAGSRSGNRTFNVTVAVERNRTQSQSQTQTRIVVDISVSINKTAVNVSISRNHTAVVTTKLPPTTAAVNLNETEGGNGNRRSQDTETSHLVPENANS